MGFFCAFGARLPVSGKGGSQIGCSLPLCCNRLFLESGL